MKTFITVVPRQNVYGPVLDNAINDPVLNENGKRVRFQDYYNPMDCEHLKFEQPCCFPVLPMINAFVRAGEEIRVIALVNYDEDGETDIGNRVNCSLLHEDVAALCQNNGISFAFDTLKIPMDERIDTHLNTFGRLIPMFNEGDILYGDITYGTKPNMFVLLMALNYAHQAMQNVFVESVVYGEKLFVGPKEKRIYDCTKLFLMDQIVSTLGSNPVADPVAFISDILHFDPNEEVAHE